MPTASDTREISAPAGELWELVSDPHHLPRWWPRVERVEGVEDSSFTQVLRSDSGKVLRADFDVSERDDRQMRLVWSQQVAGTPFARVLSSSEIELKVTPRMGMDQSAATDVTVTLMQTLPGWLAGSPPTPGARMHGGSIFSGLFARLGSPLIRKAAARTVREALDGLQRIAG
jgi:uncharacterized protein YndB with AHSA1/START domain